MSSFSCCIGPFKENISHAYHSYDLSPPKKNNNNPPLIHGVGLGIYYLLSLVVGMKIEKNISCALPKDVSQRNEEDLLPDVPTIYNDCSRQQELPVGKKGRQRESDSDQSFEP